MMVVFFLGIGLACISVGLAQTPWQLSDSARCGHMGNTSPNLAPVGSLSRG
jgi:hypothetical protein